MIKGTQNSKAVIERSIRNTQQLVMERGLADVKAVSAQSMFASLRKDWLNHKNRSHRKALKPIILTNGKIVAPKDLTAAIQSIFALSLRPLTRATPSDRRAPDQSVAGKIHVRTPRGALKNNEPKATPFSGQHHK